MNTYHPYHHNLDGNTRLDPHGIYEILLIVPNLRIPPGDHNSQPSHPSQAVRDVASTLVNDVEVALSREMRPDWRLAADVDGDAGICCDGSSVAAAPHRNTSRTVVDLPVVTNQSLSDRASQPKERFEGNLVPDPGVIHRVHTSDLPDANYRPTVELGGVPADFLTGFRTTGVISFGRRGAEPFNL